MKNRGGITREIVVCLIEFLENVTECISQLCVNVKFENLGVTGNCFAARYLILFTLIRIYRPRDLCSNGISCSYTGKFCIKTFCSELCSVKSDRYRER